MEPIFDPFSACYEQPAPLDADKKTASHFSGRTLSDACPQEIVNMDDADRHALLHDEKRRDG